MEVQKSTIRRQVPKGTLRRQESDSELGHFCLFSPSTYVVIMGYSLRVVVVVVVVVVSLTRGPVLLHNKGQAHQGEILGAVRRRGAVEKTAPDPSSLLRFRHCGCWCC